MRVNWLDRHQWRKRFRALYDRLRKHPGVNLRIVGIYQDAFAPGALAPSSHVDDVLEIGILVGNGRLRAGGEQLKLIPAIGVRHMPPVAPIAACFRQRIPKYTARAVPNMRIGRTNAIY